jgi:hypothetical protein
MLPHCVPVLECCRRGDCLIKGVTGLALTAQPDQSQRRPTTNTGSQPTEHNGLPIRVPRRPLFRTVTPYARPLAAGRSGTTHRPPPPDFIPGTNAIEKRERPDPPRGTRPRAFSDRASRAQVPPPVTRSLDPTDRDRAKWAVRWKPALNAFAVTFEGGIVPSTTSRHRQASYTEIGHPRFRGSTPHRYVARHRAVTFSSSRSQGASSVNRTCAYGSAIDGNAGSPP